MNVIVTGGAGFIGSNLVKELAMKGAKVMVIDDFSCASTVNLKNFSGDVISKDINDVEFSKLGKLDAIFHQGALTDTTVLNEKKMMRANLEGTHHILKYCVKTKTRLIYASSAAVYGNEAAPQSEEGPKNPLNVYGRSKWEADQLVLRSLQETESIIIGFRYFNVFGMGEQHKGNYASMIYQLSQQMKRGERPRIFTDGEQKRDHIYVQDVVTANLKALEGTRSGIVNIGTGKATTFNRIIEILNDVMTLSLAPDYFKNPYDFYQNETRADVSNAKALIGFEPKYSVEEGVRDYFSYLYGIKKKNHVSI
jgi:ADP-L-glycero-D-manno-heptose 6-epimerase